MDASRDLTCPLHRHNHRLCHRHVHLDCHTFPHNYLHHLRHRRYHHHHHHHHCHHHHHHRHHHFFPPGYPFSGCYPPPIGQPPCFYPLPALPKPHISEAPNDPTQFETSSGYQPTVFSQPLQEEPIGEEFDEVEEEDEDPIFVLTDEWRDFFAKSEAKRKQAKKEARKQRNSR